MDTTLLISLLTWAAVLFSAAGAYLSVNKLWIRRHELVVSQSISIPAQIISITLLIIFAMNNIILDNKQGLANGIILLGVALFSIALASGKWVPAMQSLPLTVRLKKALGVEYDELDYLAKSLQSGEEKQLLTEILQGVALIDNHLSNSEKQLIDSFAKTIGTNITWKEHSSNSPSSILALLDRYFHCNPEPTQTYQLIDIIQKVIEVDGSATEKEIALAEEMKLKIQYYLESNSNQEGYHLIYIPDDNDGKTKINNLIKTRALKLNQLDALASSRYYSKIFTEQIKKQLLVMEIKTLIIEHTEIRDFMS